ncbi:hypothetical protein Clacol_009946 [Clathrus columnatus]|uniref:DUF427 domain-containing protein n=1 Tax=Clathrus columnatus TaxID=1419009 RepID=A0AAV5ARL2_9AGAM|nr:hypothetical protein Clacol_009946 [Clathrus columnatus]
MVKVTLDGHVLAESNNTVVVEGNHYFPPDSISNTLTKDSSTSTTCPWKGVAHYYNVQVGNKKVHDVAWYYPQPKTAAADIKDHVAFYKTKVKIQE